MKNNGSKVKTEKGKEECIFCQIVAGKLATTKVFEDEWFVVINDIHPKAPVHVLIIPKKHVPTVNELEATDEAMVGRIFTLAAKLAGDLKIAQGYQLHVNVGQRAGQVVFHLHVHLTGGWSKPQEFRGGGVF